MTDESRLAPLRGRQLCSLRPGMLFLMTDVEVVVYALMGHLISTKVGKRLLVSIYMRNSCMLASCAQELGPSTRHISSDICVKGPVMDPCCSAYGLDCECKKKNSD